MLEYAIAAFTLFFVTIEPLGLAPVFISLASGMGKKQRRRIAFKAVAIAAAVLLLFAFGGKALMGALGIGFPAFRIAGGLLLLLVSIDLILARPTGLSSLTPSEEAEASGDNDISVFPLAIPLIAGPGTMTAIVLMMSQSSGQPMMQGIVIGMLLAVLALTYVTLLASEKILTVMGVTGVNVLMRVGGIILAALAVQFMLDGVIASGLVKPYP